MGIPLSSKLALNFTFGGPGKDSEVNDLKTMLFLAGVNGVVTTDVSELSYFRAFPIE